VKYGGAAMVDASLKAGVINDLVLLSCVGIRPVLVHGGGPEINGWLKKLSIEAEFKNGLRVTDGAFSDFNFFLWFFLQKTEKRRKTPRSLSLFLSSPLFLILSTSLDLSKHSTYVLKKRPHHGRRRDGPLREGQ
jgi:hypothetical protein